jgi:Zn-finger nucleic acid-binding protein
MYVAEYQQIELDLCARCEGVWFDADELELILGTAEPCRLTDVEVEEDDRRCPRCRKTMRKANIGPQAGVVIDVCPDGCGLWFDKGEVPALCRDLEADGWRLDPAVRRYLSAMFPEPPRDG